MNTIQEEYSPLPWDEFDRAIMYSIYRGETSVSIYVGNMKNKIFEWTFILNQQQLEKKCKEMKLSIRYERVKYREETIHIIARLLFPTFLSSDILYHRMLLESLQRYPKEYKVAITRSNIPGIDPDVSFPPGIDRELQEIIAPLNTEVSTETTVSHPLGDHDLQRKIDTIHYYLQLGTNKGWKEIDVYSNVSQEDVVNMQKYVTEKGYRSKIAILPTSAYDIYRLVVEK